MSERNGILGDVGTFDEFAAAANIKVVGVGGGGGNAVKAMMAAGLRNVEFIVANTDGQALASIGSVPTKIQLGSAITRGLGAGANPDVGRQAAEESREELRGALEGADMVFIAAGLGGGTGTGAAPVVAEIARELGALTVAVVTKPFGREGKLRGRRACEGADQLKAQVDSLIVVPNDRLLEAAEQLSILEAFQPSDDVLRKAVQGISELITTSGMINVDFADVKAIMSERGKAMMGIGESEDAMEAAAMAISSPLLEETNIHGARGVLVNVTCSREMRMTDFNAISEAIHELVHEEANIIIGLVIDEDMGRSIRVTAIATGFGSTEAEAAPVAAGPAAEPVIRSINELPLVQRRQNAMEARGGIDPVSPARAVPTGVVSDPHARPTFLKRLGGDADKA